MFSSRKLQKYPQMRNINAIVQNLSELDGSAFTLLLIILLLFN